MNPGEIEKLCASFHNVIKLLLIIFYKLLCIPCENTVRFICFHETRWVFSQQTFRTIECIRKLMKAFSMI